MAPASSGVATASAAEIRMLRRFGAGMRRHSRPAGGANAQAARPQLVGIRPARGPDSPPSSYLVTASEALASVLWAACLTPLAALWAAWAVPVATSEATCSVPVATSDAPLATAWPVALAACLTALAALAGAVAPSAAQAREATPIRAAAIERVRKFMLWVPGSFQVNGHGA